LQSHWVVSLIVASFISIFIYNNLKISIEISKISISPNKEGNGFAKIDVPG
jgi:hypothetical protein